eukprot:CAMPEP_0173150006 /NCGR_PEP_ID=MMETSP1105-20130129/10683_1 /TAXON_ID=2985 /ORGANISM="Ochromonas sp., Strain BG-1" /LENGTH=559 /DNA_ID=CAMNT_0014065019 /DNA_START=360 /DNA_END=2039 /DNA_ORIENTATION=+
MAGFESYQHMPEQYEGINDTSKTLFVGDLSYFCTEEDLLSIFSGYGPILTVRVRRGITGDSLMHGFVALASAESAQRAIRDLDGLEFMGRNMRVQLSADGQKPITDVKDEYIQVHVSFISKQVNYLITEKVLRDIFSQYGTVADVAIKKHSTLHKQHRQSGYGFVYFHESDAAYRAMVALKHNTVKDITLDCSISHKSEQLIQPGSSSRNSGSGSRNNYNHSGYSSYARPQMSNMSHRPGPYDAPRGGNFPPHSSQPFSNQDELRFSSYNSNPQSQFAPPFSQPGRVNPDPVLARLQAGTSASNRGFPGPSHDSYMPPNTYTPTSYNYSNAGPPHRRTDPPVTYSSTYQNLNPRDLNASTYSAGSTNRFSGYSSGMPSTYEKFPLELQSSGSTYSGMHQSQAPHSNQSYLDPSVRRGVPSENYSPSILATSFSDLSIRTQNDLPRSNSDYSSQPNSVYDGFHSDSSFHSVPNQVLSATGNRTSNLPLSPALETTYNVTVPNSRGGDQSLNYYGTAEAQISKQLDGEKRSNDDHQKISIEGYTQREEQSQSREKKDQVIE